MADQLKTASAGVQEKGSEATEGTPLNGIQEKAQAGSDKVLSSLDGIASKIFTKGQSMIDAIFPPEKRAAFVARLQDFMLRNPKLSVSSPHYNLDVDCLLWYRPCQQYHVMMVPTSWTELTYTYRRSLE